jgi:hypothetical protein
MPGPTLPIPKSKITYFTTEGNTPNGGEYFPLSFVDGEFRIQNLWKALIDPNKTLPNFEYRLFMYDCSQNNIVDVWNNSTETNLVFTTSFPLTLVNDLVSFTLSSIAMFALQNIGGSYCFYCLCYDDVNDTYSFLPTNITHDYVHEYEVSTRIFDTDIIDGVTDKTDFRWRLKRADIPNISYLYLEHYEEEILTESEIILQADLSSYDEYPADTDYGQYRRSISSTLNANVIEIIYIIGIDNSISRGIYFEFVNTVSPEYLNGQKYELSVNYQKKGMLYRLHPILKTLFWEQFIEGVSEELFNHYKQATELKDLINAESSNADTLLALATKFGYVPNRILDNTITFLQREVNNIGLRVQMKGTYDGYKFIFRLVNALGYIYNVFHNNNKFIRAIQETETFSLLRDYIADWTQAFTGIEPFPYYSLSLDSYLLMDEGTDMDADPLDYMDELLVSHPTKHLAIEWLIDETFIDPDDSVEKLMNLTRLEYVLFSSLYNRKLTDYPHVGAQVSFPCDETGYYNKLTNGTGSYTVQDLKVRSSVTPLYRSIIQTLENVIMDDTPVSILDPSLPEFFDQSFIATKKIDIATDFYRIVAGNGNKNQISFNNGSKELNTKYDNTIFHVGFDEAFDVFCIDSSLNKYQGELLGTATRAANGIISRSYYNPSGQGVAYFPSIQHTSTDRETSLWVKGIGKVGTTGTIFNCGYLKIEKPNTANYDFKFTFTGNVTSGDITLTYNTTTDPAYITTPIFIYVSFNETTSTMTASLQSSNQTVTNTLDYSTFGTIASPIQLTMGGDYDSGTTTISNASTGYIDDAWISEYIMSANEKSYVFTNRTCDMSYIDKKFYEYQIQDEVYEDLLWYIVTGRIDGKGDCYSQTLQLYK